MPFETASKYHMAIQSLRARMLLDQINVVSHPYKTKAQQKTFIDSLKKDLYAAQEKKVLTTRELFDKMSSGVQDGSR